MTKEVSAVKHFIVVKKFNTNAEALILFKKRAFKTVTWSASSVSDKDSDKNVLTNFSESGTLEGEEALGKVLAEGQGKYVTILDHLANRMTDDTEPINNKN